MRAHNNPGRKKEKPRPDRADSEGNPGTRLRLPWREITLSIAATVLFFGLLEGGLFLFGTETVLERDDPFAGFVPSVPLFVEAQDSHGRQILVTAENKREFFNKQEFLRDRPPEAFRIFSLGGSTTYGRPYDDTTSFSGWLRELLPTADPSREWEVINAGGISYASYRVVRLMEDLVRFQPDLFIVYSGHNEFLEERTYGALRDTPSAVRSFSALLARTRTWAAVRSLLISTGMLPQESRAPSTTLSDEVNTKLEQYAGPELYVRDDPLRDQILSHYRSSLQRMVEIVDSAGVQLVFVTPASNLKDCSPFKSQIDSSLSQQDAARLQQMVLAARERIKASDWPTAITMLEEAQAIDPRFAETHYLRGQALLALGRIDEAEAALELARDEDVCPLRALTPMRTIMEEVARETATPLVDFVQIIEEQSRDRFATPIAGEELFLDHVHPTIEGNRILAVALVDQLIDLGIVQPTESWGNELIEQVAERHERGLDKDLHAQALANLAQVLNWAGKKEDALRLAFRALDLGIEDSMSLAMVGMQYALEGRRAQALEYYRRAIRANPTDTAIHFQTAILLLDLRELEQAAAHLTLAIALWPDNYTYHQYLAEVLIQRGNYSDALERYAEAQRLNPQEPRINARIRELENLAPAVASNPQPARLFTANFPSGLLSTACQKMPDASGQLSVHGLCTEWYESGDLRRFVHQRGDEPSGIELIWDPDGNLLSRQDQAPG